MINAVLWQQVLFCSVRSVCWRETRNVWRQLSRQTAFLRRCVAL
jgi:hypothetical protein